MDKSFFFPHIESRKYKGRIVATAGIGLAYLHSVRLNNSSEKEADNSGNPFKLHRALLQAVVNWPETFQLSLNIITEPEAGLPLSGKVHVTILLSNIGEDRQSIYADLLSRYANLYSLLSNFLDKAEFKVIDDKTELKKVLNPFDPKFIFAIDRVKDIFSLTADSKDKQEGQAPGFLTPAINKKKKPETPTIDYIFPWQQNDDSDLSTVTEALLFHPSPLWLQVRLRPSKISQEELGELNSSLTLCEELLNGLHSDQSILSQQTKALRSAISERIWKQQHPVFRGGCFLCSASTLDEALVAAVATAISPAPDTREEPYLPLKGSNSIEKIPIKNFRERYYLSTKGFFSVDEAACAFRIPWLQQKDPVGLPIKLYRSALADASLLRDTEPGMLLLGYNRHRGHVNPIMVSTEDRMRHSVIMGQTGTGKSVFIESMIRQDIDNGKGLCFIDPHGDSIEKILRFFPKERVEELIIMDFLHRDRIIPFNLLAWENQEERDKIIDDLYGWLDLTYDLAKTGGPIFEQYFRAFLRLLMGDEPREDFTPTILDFPRLFIDKDFRNYCLEQNRDPQVRMMIEQARKAGGEASIRNIAPYITSKFNRFELDQNLRLMTGQSEMLINFNEIMNSGKVLLVNLGRGRFGETTSSLLASQIISRLHNAAMKRIEMKPEDRRDFFLYVDEFQTVASKPFISMLAEARKFRLGLILANQYADQLDQQEAGSNDSILKAVLGNVGSTTCFRLGINDAKTMADVFQPEFGSEDLVNLPIGTCYMNLKTGRSKPSSFSMETVYSEEPGNQKMVKALRDLSALKYARDREIVQMDLRDHDEFVSSL